MHHRRARVTRSVKNLSLNAISLICGLKVTHPFVDKRCAGQLCRPSSVWQKRPYFCRTKAPTLDYPSMWKIGKNHLERAVLKENNGMLGAISQFNRSYLLLAQRALRQGDIKGGQLLGVSDETAVLISQLTEAQIENLSNRSDLLCEIRLSDPADLMARI